MTESATPTISEATIRAVLANNYEVDTLLLGISTIPPFWLNLWAKALGSVDAVREYLDTTLYGPYDRSDLAILYIGDTRTHLLYRRDVIIDMLTSLSNRIQILVPEDFSVRNQPFAMLLLLGGWYSIDIIRFDDMDMSQVLVRLIEGCPIGLVRQSIENDIDLSLMRAVAS